MLNQLSYAATTPESTMPSNVPAPPMTAGRSLGLPGRRKSAGQSSSQTGSPLSAAGVWPAEGAISPAFLRLLAGHGCKWTASGSHVLANSLRGAGSPQALYRPYHLEAAGPQLAIFFRDDRLSDLIGFEYEKWNSHDAAANLIAELEAIAAGAKEGTPLVSVILDGENCWDSYAYNGYYFLTALYQALESHPSIRTTTYRAYLEQPGGAPLEALPQLVSGSWVHGSFSTWIGSPEKNHAWDLLCTAKQSFDLVIGSERLPEPAARVASRQLAACEASDWFWWPGTYNPRYTVECFDRMYRDNLINLYRLLELPAPSALALPISRGGGHPEAGGTMRRAEANS